MLTLDDALDRWGVIAPGEWENDDGPTDWWAVVNDHGIVAYFPEKWVAFWFRLAMINLELNRPHNTTGQED